MKRMVSGERDGVIVTDATEKIRIKIATPSMQRNGW
jgi:hypothetical protein